MPVLPDEAERLAELRRFGVLDSARELAFDRITRLASSILETPIALITLLDETRQWFKSAQGLTLTQTPREQAFCDHAIASTQTMVVPDAHADPRFVHNPLVTGEPHIRFYAGAPLTTPAGFNLGTLCVIDRTPRAFSALQCQVLADLAALVVDELQLRLERALAERRAEGLQQIVTLFNALPQGVVLFDAAFRCVWANDAMGEIFDLPVKQMLGWTPEEATAHVASLCLDPEAVLQRMEAMRDVSPGESSAAVFELVRPRHRVMRRTLHRLSDPDRPWLAMWTDISDEDAQLRRSEHDAVTDPLTGLPNRRAGEVALAHALATRGPVSIVLFDVDHFKLVNDRFGHPVGDEVLRAVGHALMDVAREGDVVCRWGGEEFVAVVRAGVEGARVLAERVREAVEQLDTRAGRVTVSAGVARIERFDELERADERLYEAKHAGRNRVVG